MALLPNFQLKNVGKYSKVSHGIVYEITIMYMLHLYINLSS